MAATGSAGGAGGAAPGDSTRGFDVDEVRTGETLLATSEGEDNTSSDIEALMTKHRTQVDDLARRVADAVPAGATDGTWMKYDDLFFLRYILSFGTAAAAEAACRECLRVRATPAHRTRAQLAADGTWLELPAFKVLQRYQTGGVLPDAQKHGGITVVIRVALCDFKASYLHLTPAELTNANLLFREACYKICDEATRANGKLARQLMMIDLADAGLGIVTDQTQNKINAEMSRVSGVLYPQLLLRTVAVNTPKWVAAAYKVVSRIFPKRFTDKVAMFASTDDLWASPLAEVLDRSRFPTWLGGTLPDSEVPAELTGETFKPDGDQTAKVVVAARSKHVERVVVPISGSTIQWLVGVEAHGVAVSAVLHHGEGDGYEAAERLTGATTLLVRGKPDKVKAETGASKGAWLCPRAGVAEIELDNSYSMLRSKTVHFSFEVVPPMTEGADESPVSPSDAKVAGEG